MKQIKSQTIGLLAITSVFLFFSFTFNSPSSIDEIRMCSLEVEKNSCPVDNPVFQSTAQDIYISVTSSNLTDGDNIRFTWYYLPKDDYFSNFLGTVFETVSNEKIEDGKRHTLSHFPKDIEVKPGNYEVVIHTNENEKPIIKSFKVLD